MQTLHRHSMVTGVNEYAMSTTVYMYKITDKRGETIKCKKATSI